MSKRELQDEVETLKNRLKRKDAHIQFLKEKLNDQQRKTNEISKLALKISDLCDPTIGNSVKQEWDYVVSRVTDGTSILVSTDVLERAPSTSWKSSNNETLQQETAGDIWRSGKVKTSHVCDEDSQFYLTSGRIDRRNGGNRRNKFEVIDTRVNQKSILSEAIKHSRLENQQESAPVQSIEKVRRKMMVNQAKAMSAPGRRYKSGKSRPKPPEFKPAKKIDAFLLPDESEARASSAELILVPASLKDLSIERCPYKRGEPMSLLTNYNSEPYSGDKNDQPIDRMISDRSLSSIAKILPSVPSPQNGSFGNMGPFINLGKLGRESSNDSEFINLAGEGRTLSPRL